MKEESDFAELTEADLRTVWGAGHDFFHDIGYSIGYAAGAVVDFFSGGSSQPGSSVESGPTPAPSTDLPKTGGQ